MASSESNTFEESTNSTRETTRENMPLATSPALMEHDVVMEQEKPTYTEKHTGPAATMPQRSASYRGLRLSECQPDDEDASKADDSWWSEVENNDLLLDQVPHVTSVFTPSPESILGKSISVAESESVCRDENFDRLHKIADKIKMTLSEHAKNKELEEKAEKAEKERKLSETDDSKDHKTGYSESLAKEQSLEEFKEELRSKRLQRQNAVQDLRDEIASLRRQLDLEREVNKRLRRGEHLEESTFSTSEEGACAAVPQCSSTIQDDEDSISRRRHANIELANAQLALQMANSENISLRGELAVVQKQVVTLKEVIACCKQMLAVKEEQCNEIFR